MLVVSQKLLSAVEVNTMTLKKDNLYFYVHRDVYDKAVILEDSWNLEKLIDYLSIKNNLETIEYFYQEAPKPINILAPYLGLIEEGMGKNLEECCGALHVITSIIDARKYLMFPVEIRKTVDFSLSIKEEYQMAWDRFFKLAQVVNYNVETNRDFGLEFSSNVNVDPDDIVNNPDWEEVAPGIYRNIYNGETRVIESEDSELDDFLSQLKSAEEDPEPNNIELTVENTVIGNDPEKDKIRELLNFRK